MDTQLSQHSKRALLNTELHTPTLVGLENPHEAALAMRTTDLFPLRRSGLRLMVKPICYQGKEGIWIVAIIFQIAGIPTGTLEGAAYLNPCKMYDLTLLQSLIKQEQLLILFYSPRLRVVVSRPAPWTVHQRQDLRLTLAQMGRVQQGENQQAEEDPEFTRVKKEFERIYSVTHLLITHTSRATHFSSPFKGAMLD